MQGSSDAFILAGHTAGMQPVVFASSSKNKFQEVMSILLPRGIETEFVPLDLVEIQSDSLEKIAKEKVRNAFEKVSLNSWRKNVDMHLNGYFICCKNAAEYMKKRKSGSIINFGSIYGILGPQFSVYKGTKMTVAAPYSAIKGGIINFTRYLASYYGKYNIRVNCVSPGGVYDKQNKLFIKQYKDRTPLGRMADKEDIIGGALYMASDASKYVTGHNLIIDGGWSII